MNNDNKIKLAIMQPYFFPYLGYFQVMNAVDKYVVYDDVNYIKGGRINRNVILCNNKPLPINLLLSQASPNKHINEIELLGNEKEIIKFLRTISQNYGKAPYFNQVYPLIEQIMTYDEKNLGFFLYNSFKRICDYLKINTQLILSSTLQKDCSLKAERKVYHICKLLNASDYYNSIGGKDLYSHEEFEKQGINLHFLTMNDNIKYKQFGEDFVPYLSIIDVMMFNSVEDIHILLGEYTLS